MAQIQTQTPSVVIPLRIPKFFRRTILVSPIRWYNFSFILLLISFFVGIGFYLIVIVIVYTLYYI